MKTKDRLVSDLLKADAPGDMVLNARSGHYDDYESPNATPILNLISDCRKNGLNDIAFQATQGKYDGTKEEGDAWFEREGKDLLK